MDEIDKCLEVLGLKPGATEEEVQQAYRELAMVWHPDRFAADSPLQAKANAKLQELNAAYEFLLAHGFKNGVAVSSEKKISESEPAPEEEISERSPKSNQIFWILGVVLLAAILIGLWLQHRTKESNSEISRREVTNTVDSASHVFNTPSAPILTAQMPEKASAINSSTNDLLPSMMVGGSSKLTNSAEGTVLTGDGWLHTVEEYSPPFVIHAVVKTDLNNIRLLYGKGVVIFNWEMNASELRFHDPASGKINAVAGQGRVPVNEWQDIEWRVETNFSTVSVNGTERARISGNYQGMAELAAITTGMGSTLTIKLFEVRKTGPDVHQKSFNPNAGLVLYFPFEADENGSVTDQSGFKNNGIVHGAKFVHEGKVGGAMSFNGGSKSGDSIVVANSASLDSMQRTRQMTVCAWIKLNSLPPEFSVILSKGGNFLPKSFGGYELNLHAYGDNGLNFVSGRYGLVCFRESEQWFPRHLHEWIHIAAVINATANTGKLYVNGQRMDDQAFTGNSHDANFALINDLIIGAPAPSHHSNRACFDGLIDEVRIYARALTLEEIRSLPGFPKSNP